MLRKRYSYQPIDLYEWKGALVYLNTPPGLMQSASYVKSSWDTNLQILP